MIRLLAVDDDEPVTLALRRYFGARGFEVDCAPGLEEARTFLEGRSYGLVITDLRLAGGAEGYEVLEAARASSPGCGRILLTARGGPAVDREARARGADAVVEKPVPLRELARVAEVLLAAKGGPPARAKGPA